MIHSRLTHVSRYLSHTYCSQNCISLLRTQPHFTLRQCLFLCWCKAKMNRKPAVHVYLLPVANSYGTEGTLWRWPQRSVLCSSTLYKYCQTLLSCVFKHFVQIYLLTAIGLTPGGSSTVHIYTQTIHRTIQLIWEECGPCPVFASYTLAFALQLRKKHGKTSVRVEKSQSG
jgi:hypothetical protein